MKKHSSRLLRMVLIVYTLIICLSGWLVFRSNFRELWNEQLRSLDKTLNALSDEFKETTGDFWRYYLPLVTSDGSTRAILDAYFSSTSEQELSPIEKQELLDALTRFNNSYASIQWIALRAAGRKINYCYYHTNSDIGSLEILPAGFPFLQSSLGQGALMEVLGREIINGKSYYAVVGGAPSRGKNDMMIFGFSSDILSEIAAAACDDYKSLCFVIVEDGRIIFTTAGTDDEDEVYITQERTMQTVNHGGSHLLVYPHEQPSKRFNCYFTIRYSELFLRTWRLSSPRFFYLIALAAISISMLFIYTAVVNREVSIIRRGLKRISDNQLDHRFALNFYNDGFNEIALSINKMAEELQRTLEKTYQFEIKQREYEMADLLAKFDPHFLYNTLELFRARCMRNGDSSTAELISHAALLFRGQISSKTVVTVQEELAFSEHYMRLFRGRYGDRARIQYDFETPLLSHTILRNILQPLIENYFEHGFDGQKNDNYLKLSGEITDGKNILITVSDNGRGMSDEMLANLMQRINDPTVHEGESYGLKNLQQRIKLYYGPKYSLTIKQNEEGGITVSILLPLLEETQRPRGDRF